MACLRISYEGAKHFIAPKINENMPFDNINMDILPKVSQCSLFFGFQILGGGKAPLDTRLVM